MKNNAQKRLKVYPQFFANVLTREKHGYTVFHTNDLFYWMTHNRLLFRFLDGLIFVGVETGSFLLGRWSFPCDEQTFSVADFLLPQIHPCTKITTENIKCFNTFPCMLAIKKHYDSKNIKQNLSLSFFSKFSINQLINNHVCRTYISKYTGVLQLELSLHRKRSWC